MAAPIDIILLFWGGWVGSKDALLVRPFAEALLYIYAFILAVETLFRIAHHPDILAVKPWLRILQVIAGVIILFFIIDYMNVLRPMVEAHESAAAAYKRQLAVASASVLASILSFVACERGRRQHGLPYRLESNH
ncbi:hypothetical protein [Bradyrhizobium nitroreducens]|uniref:hypothetical protein n=1 Tax=Bradyrhizobium nitroreducens TaxID=709803 RepID=UPI000C1F5321|nr:hypothetical protein [Bradyrhizobium nitroreducens]